MTGFFEVISISAPHIYHSTLLLSPKTSIARSLYGPQASPLARVVQGVPTSWDPNIASTNFPGGVGTVAWSPCSRFIAVSQYLSDKVAVLDAATLEKIYTTCPVSRPEGPEKLMFSPDGRFLTGYFDAVASLPGFIANWDLQTGGLISSASRVTDHWMPSSMTYSECGTMIGLLFVESSATTITTYNILSATITTYNVLSGMRISFHSVEKAVTPTIWTHDECLRFATEELTSITIWEAGFTSKQPPTKAYSLPIPDGFTSGGFHALSPTLSWLVFVFEGRVVVWDAQHRKILLDSAEVMDPEQVSFSPDGRFITYGTEGPEVCHWKECPPGYPLHRIFVTGAGFATQIVSPDGESVVTFGSSIVQLWRTVDSPTFLSGVLIQSFRATPENFILEFSPDEKLVAVTRPWDSTITVLNLKSGDVRAVIDTGTGIYSMRITGSTIATVTLGKVITWDLPVGDDALNVRMDTNDSVRTSMFDNSMPTRANLYVSISPDLNHIASKRLSGDLHIYNMQSGKLLAVAKSMGHVPGFTPDGRVVWCAAADGQFDRWKITRDETLDVTKLESLGSTEHPLEGFPWRSSHGYQVTDDGWVVNSDKKRLLWLPHNWRSGKKFIRMWRRKFLALLHGELPEVVVLELEF